MPFFRKRKVQITAIDCSGTQKAIEVKGEATYQKALERIAGPKTDGGGAPDVVAYLKPDPTNPYDGNAVKVLVQGLHVGFINRDDAEWVQKGLPEDSRSRGQAGGDEGSACRRLGQRRWRHRKLGPLALV